MNGNMLSPVLDLKEAAALLHVHPDTLAEMAGKGDAPGIKIGKRWVFETELLLGWLRDRIREEVATKKRLASGGDNESVRITSGGRKRGKMTSFPDLSKYIAEENVSAG